MKKYYNQHYVCDISGIIYAIKEDKKYIHILPNCFRLPHLLPTIKTTELNKLLKQYPADHLLQDFPIKFQCYLKEQYDPLSFYKPHPTNIPEKSEILILKPIQNNKLSDNIYLAKINNTYFTIPLSIDHISNQTYPVYKIKPKKTSLLIIGNFPPPPTIIQIYLPLYITKYKYSCIINTISKTEALKILLE